MQFDNITRNSKIDQGDPFLEVSTLIFIFVILLISYQVKRKRRLQRFSKFFIFLKILQVFSPPEDISKRQKEIMMYFILFMQFALIQSALIRQFKQYSPVIRTLG